MRIGNISERLFINRWRPTNERHYTNHSLGGYLFPISYGPRVLVLQEIEGRREEMKSKDILQYRVLVKDHEDNSEVIVEESSWYLLTQTGKLLYSKPFGKIKEIDAPDIELIPLIKIKDWYMSVQDIESMIDDYTELGELKINKRGKK